MNDQKQTTTPAPEWDVERREWGHWEPDPEDPEFEVWVRDEAKEKDAESGEATEPVQGTTVADPRKAEAKEAVSADLAWADGREPKRRCSARRTNGEPCRKAAMAGSTVCRNHGGAAPQVKAKARVRLENAADRMARQLLGMAMDDKVPAYVKLEAIKTALDRAGISPKTAVEVEVGPAKGWEVAFAGIAGGPRPDELAPAPTGNNLVPEEFAAHAAMMDEDMGVLDAEVVEGYDADRALNPRDAPEGTHRPRYNASDTAGRSYGAVAGELTTAERAVEEVARINRSAPAARPKHE